MRIHAVSRVARFAGRFRRNAKWSVVRADWPDDRQIRVAADNPAQDVGDPRRQAPDKAPERLTFFQSLPMISVCRSVDSAEREAWPRGQATRPPVDRQWHVIDANGQVLGRVATPRRTSAAGQAQADLDALPRHRRSRRHRQRRARASSPAARKNRSSTGTTAATKAACAKSARRSSARSIRSGSSKKRCAACCRRPSWARRCIAS